MECLWSEQGLLQERWCCARGRWIMAVLTGLSQTIHVTSFSYSVLVPHIMGILSIHSQHNHTTEFVASTKEPTRGLPTSPVKKTPNSHRMMLSGEEPRFSCPSFPLLTKRLHANHKIFKKALKQLSKSHLTVDPSNVFIRIIRTLFSNRFSSVQNIQFPVTYFLWRPYIYMSYFWFAYNIIHNIRIRAQSIDFAKTLNVILTFGRSIS